MYTEEDLKNMKLFARGLSQHYAIHGTHAPEAVFLSHNGFDIFNPWLSDCSRFDVNPADEYGHMKFDNWCYNAAGTINSTDRQVPTIDPENTFAVETWLKELQEKNLLWHMDDSPMDCLESALPFFARCRLLQEQEKALQICQQAGVDIFDLYPTVEIKGVE